LPAIRDAWERHLKPAAAVVPQRARVYAQLIAADWLLDLTGLRMYQFAPTEDGSTDDTTCSISFNLDSAGSKPLFNASQVIFPVHADKLIRDKRMRLSSDPIELFEFDVTSKENIPSPEGRERTVHVTANESDVIVHGVLVWWELELYDGIVYSTAPGKEPWQDHWHPCVHPFHEPHKVSKDQSVTLQVSHNDSRIFIVLPDQKNEKQSSKRPKVDLIMPQPTFISPERAFQLNDGRRDLIGSVGHCGLRWKSMQRIRQELVMAQLYLIYQTSHCVAFLRQSLAPTKSYLWKAVQVNLQKLQLVWRNLAMVSILQHLKSSNVTLSNSRLIFWEAHRRILCVVNRTTKSSKAGTYKKR